MSKKNRVPYEVTLEVRDACICLHLQRGARIIARRFDEALRELGLTNGQFSLLMSLNRPQPPGMGDVARVLAMDRTTLTANVKPLERRGLLKIEIEEEDKRARRLRLTQAGHALLLKALPIWRREHRAIESRIGAAEMNRLRAALLRLS